MKVLEAATKKHLKKLGHHTALDEEPLYASDQQMKNTLETLFDRATHGSATEVKEATQALRSAHESLHRDTHPPLTP